MPTKKIQGSYRKCVRNPIISPGSCTDNNCKKFFMVLHFCQEKKKRAVNEDIAQRFDCRLRKKQQNHCHYLLKLLSDRASAEME